MGKASKRTKPTKPTKASKRTKRTKPTEPTKDPGPTKDLEPTEPTEPTEEPEPTEPTEPEPSQEPAARRISAPDEESGAVTRAAGRVRTRLPGGMIAVAGISAGAAAVLLASGALIAMSRSSGGVNEELASFKQVVSALSGRMADLEGKIAGEQAARMAELKKALAEAEKARDAAESALDGAELFKPTPGLAQVLLEFEQVAKLPSMPEKAKQRLEKARESYEREQKQLIAEHDKLRKQRYYDRTKEASRQRRARLELQRTLAKWSRMLQEAALSAVRDMYKLAREAEAKQKLEEALSHYQDVASVRIRSAATYAAYSRKRVLIIRRKIEAPAPVERRKRGRVRPGATPKGPPAVPPGRGVEVF